MNSKKIVVAVSACVVGEKVRFDGGHKISDFLTQELSSFFTYQPICPEVAIGMPVPRPAIRLTQSDDLVRLTETKNPEKDYSREMLAFSDHKISELKTTRVCGYVVCAKSPTCGMERVKVYKQNQAEKSGIGLYTQQLIEQMPWLPVEEDGRLHDPVLRENFIARVFALDDLYTSIGDQPTVDKIIRFHSRYKLTLMAHYPIAYRELGQLVASMSQYKSVGSNDKQKYLEQFYLDYREKLMQALRHRATRRNNTNVLMHLQGYFKRVLNRMQKAELAKLIDDYRLGYLPLLVPVTLIKHYLAMYPDPYLQQQHFLSPYPQELGLRYGL